MPDPTDAPTPAARSRFLAALGLFAAWVVALLGMAVTSAERPRPRAEPPVETPADAPSGATPR